MLLELEIPDDEIREKLKDIIAERLIYAEYAKEFNAYRREIKDATREIIYKDKANIVDMVVRQASREVKNKALQQFLAEMSNKED